MDNPKDKMVEKEKASMHRAWTPASATLEIGGVIRTVHAPSKLQLRGGLTHLALAEASTFMMGAATAKPINYVVDVGANIGATALMFHTAFPEARILAIEPVTLNWDCLVRNTEDIPNIKRLKMAAGEEKRRINICMPSVEQRPDLAVRHGNSGLYSVYGEDADSGEEVDMDKLDNIVDGPVDLLKLDVEGAEGSVLVGARRIMSKDRPVVVIELRKANIAMGGHTDQDYLDYFETAGYRLAGQYVGDFLFVPDELDTLAWEEYANRYKQLR